MELSDIFLLFSGGLLAGMINVMAGGAGFMTFPLLVAAGLSEIEANASNFVALLPANVVGTYVYRGELAEVRKHLVLRLCLAALGALTGSAVLIHIGQSSFVRAVPWLLLVATLSFGFGPLLKARLERHFSFDASRWLWLSFILEFLVYVYGGFFGLGMSIVMFAIYAVFSRMDIHQSNALRNITFSLMTMVSIAIFASGGLIRWVPSLVMMVGAVIGGYVAVSFAKRVSAQAIRQGLLVWAICLTGLAFWKYL